MNANARPGAWFLSLAILPLLLASASKADEKCEGWINEILEDSTELISDQMTIEVSWRDECEAAEDELIQRQWLAVMKPEMFAESRLAFSVYRACMDQHMEDAQACMRPDATAGCPPSDECDEVHERYQCVFNTAKAYENEWNKLQERKAMDLADELVDKKCVGDESDIWDAINQMWESMEDRNPDLDEE
jgi:hypothetical protein